MSITIDVDARGCIDLDNYVDVLEIHAAGLGHPNTTKRKIQLGLVPAIRVGGKYLIARDDLDLLRPTVEVLPAAGVSTPGP